MEKRAQTISVIALAVAAVIAGCSGTREQSALYILEELAAASAVKDCEERVERLEIFIGNHPEHCYRLRAYETILETLASDLGDKGRAQQYLDAIMEKESDPAVRGMLYYHTFAFLYNTDKDQALELAEALIEGGEPYYRLYLYIGYRLYGEEGMEELTEHFLARAASLGRNEYERSQALAVLGSYLEYRGQRAKALEYLERAGGNPYANETRGKILWEEGDRRDALDAYMDYVAVVPAARESLRLDSLYALVYDGANDLDRRLIGRRITDQGALPSGRFVDINGKRHNLDKYRGKKLVVNIWNPT
jgi:tetratricopeptide (TPR) repeat protein